ncbi:hypothetical protein IV203_004010 [Nitzschia inconspicua]|uniref:Uncharacterized protein n=1 Tax=Nitzschia inconspicua TaxID=303405 RepID=A0A9K3L3M7_9STRA|nr:hypothetical protein IV203_004010 [Nitzschia inconspicua]
MLLQYHGISTFRPPSFSHNGSQSTSCFASSIDQESLLSIDSSPLEKVVSHFQDPIRHTVLPFPWDNYDESVVFFQRATSTRIQGLESLKTTCQLWEREFVDDLSGMEYKHDDNLAAIHPTSTIQRIFKTSPTTMVLQWNMTYIAPTVQWLPNVAAICGWTLDPRPYNDQAGQGKTFSYKSMLTLFWDAIVTQKLRIPLACIEGTTVCEISKNSQIVSITEDLAYAQDLQRGVLQNRLCGQDLQSFLETARRPVDESREAWQEHVANSLPWSTVPGLTDPLAIEPMNEEEEQLVPTLFLGTVTLFN